MISALPYNWEKVNYAQFYLSCMQLRNRYWGSTVAIVIGTLSTIVGINLLSEGKASTNLEVGVGMVVGALAYRSVKKRVLGLSKTTVAHLILEYIYLAIEGLIVLLGVATGQAYWYPVSFVFIPLWAFGAYFVVVSLARRGNVQAATASSNRHKS